MCFDSTKLSPEATQQPFGVNITNPVTLNACGATVIEVLTSTVATSCRFLQDL
jgi:hypothetical protein